MKQPTAIKNTFLDFICLSLSFVFSFFRSITLLFSWQNSRKTRNVFFDLLDFVFRLWPAYFWKKPTGLKLTSFFADLLQHLFKR